MSLYTLPQHLLIIAFTRSLYNTGSYCLPNLWGIVNWQYFIISKVHKSGTFAHGSAKFSVSAQQINLTLILSLISNYINCQFVETCRNSSLNWKLLHIVMHTCMSRRLSTFIWFAVLCSLWIIELILNCLRHVVIVSNRDPNSNRVISSLLMNLEDLPIQTGTNCFPQSLHLAQLIWDTNISCKTFSKIWDSRVL